MLTATYSHVAISAEQDKTRSSLSRLQQFLQTAWKGLQSIDFGFLESCYGRFVHFDHYFQNRKLELYLIPALRGMSREADLLIAELEALSAKAGYMLHAAGSQLSAGAAMGRLQVSQLCDAMHTYCHHVAARLTLEEQALLPLAQRMFSVEDWFRLAAQFLAGEGRGRFRRSRPPHERTERRAGTSNDFR